MLALVGRELCLFLRVDATRIPAGQRPGFVALAVRRAAPFADPDHDAYWHDGHAAVWYWSRERVRTLVDRPGQDIRYRAEPIFLGEPATGNAVELLALDSTGADDGGDGEPTNGIEARVWRNGQLVADRWWPRPPDGSAWRDFARGAGLDQSAIEPPPPTRAAMRTQPLSATGQRVALAGWFDRYRPLAIAAAPVLVLALLAWQVAGIARVAREARAVDTRIEELSAQLSRIIDARTQADASQRQVEALLALRAPASQVRLLGEVNRLTPGSWQLMHWTLPSPDTLEVRFKMANADVPALVAAWESSELLQDVAPANTARPDEVALQARLTPLLERAMEPAPEASP